MSTSGLADEELRGLPALGTVVSGKYRLDALIGRGGMAAVYSATQLLTRRRVAIKWLYAHIARNAEVVERFVREARAASMIDHPNVVTIFDLERHEQSFYMVMELLSGESLRERLDRGRMDLMEALQVAMPVCSALASAHEHGIIHRDLKPENVFLRHREDGTTRTAKVVDFGISKLTAEESLTLTGMVVGTPAYLSPEQASGEPIGPTADVYQLGVLLYEMLSGTVPFDRDNYAAMLCAILADTPTPLGALRPDLPKGVVEIIERAMARNASERFQNARELSDALAPFSRWVDNESLTSIGETSSPRTPAFQVDSSPALPSTRLGTTADYGEPRSGPEYPGVSQSGEVAIPPARRVDAAMASPSGHYASQRPDGDFAFAPTAQPQSSASHLRDSGRDLPTLPVSNWHRVLLASILGGATMASVVGGWLVWSRSSTPTQVLEPPRTTDQTSDNRASGVESTAGIDQPSSASELGNTIRKPDSRPASVAHEDDSVTASDTGTTVRGIDPPPPAASSVPRESPRESPRTAAPEERTHSRTRESVHRASPTASPRSASAPPSASARPTESPHPANRPSVRAGHLSVDDF